MDVLSSASIIGCNFLLVYVLVNCTIMALFVTVQPHFLFLILTNLILFISMPPHSVTIIQTHTD